MWLERAGKLVLVRRAPDGLFGGLWELPPVELVEALRVNVDPEPVAHHEQVLTHRRLRITVIRGAAPARLPGGALTGYDAIARVKLAAAAQLGIAAATAAILAKYHDAPWA
jgi:hypothetical protein